MAKEIINKCKNLKLLEEEMKAIELGSSGGESSLMGGERFRVAASLLSTQPYNYCVLGRTIGRLAAVKGSGVS